MNYVFRKNDKGQVYIHRSWLKMIGNPVLSVFGLQIISNFEGNRFIGYKIGKPLKKV